MARIVVIEDEADLREIIEYNVSQAGHRVHMAATGEAGMRIARELRPDVVLLDLMLPDMSGTDVCKALKSDPLTREARLIMVTAKGEEIDRVVGFELGADDYVVKPFSVRELLLRIQAVLRRTSKETSNVIRAGELAVDRDAHRVSVDGQPITLTALEFKLLLTLLERPNRVQTRGTLLSDVWGLDAGLATRTVDTHVKRLREKLGSAGRYIETVRGVGYRFCEVPMELAS